MYLIYQQVWSLFWYHFKLLCFHIRCLCFHIKCFCFHIRSFMFPYKVLMFSYKVIMFPYKMFMFSNTSWSSIIYLKLAMSATHYLQFRVHQPTHASKGCIRSLATSFRFFCRPTKPYSILDSIPYRVCELHITSSDTRHEGDSLSFNWFYEIWIVFSRIILFF